jgi:hypothetical protein
MICFFCFVFALAFCECHWVGDLQFNFYCSRTWMTKTSIFDVYVLEYLH